MAAWIACALVAIVLLKPQEFIPALAGLPLVHLAFAAAIVASAADLIRRRVHVALAPQIPFLIAFFAWAALVTAVKRSSQLEPQLVGFGILAGLFAAVSVGCASQKGLRALAVTLTACAALTAIVAIVQSQRPLGCFLAAPDDWEGRGELTPDGRPCVTVQDCREHAPVPDGNYRCERGGPLATATLGGRVRYRGSLADPNELALVLCVVLPFAVALARSRQSPPAPAPAPAPALLPPLLTDALIRRVVALVRAAPVLALHVAIAVVVVLSRSRTGLLVFLAVVGLEAIRRSGAWGVVLGCIVGPPMLLFGGRSGVEADDSTDERAEILREAFELIRATKGFGLGAGQFGDASSIGMTAHNAYVLAAAETGLVGYMLFWFALYLSLKVPLVIWLRDGAFDRSLAPWAAAIALAITGALVGVLFLSWTYKDVLFILLGASAALWSAARARDRGLRADLSLREAAVVAACAVGLLAVVYAGSRLHRR